MSLRLTHSGSDSGSVSPDGSETARRTRKAARLENNVKEAQEVAKLQPEKAERAVDTAQARLEKYFDNNLQQVTQIFITAIVTIAVGFGFFVACVMLSFRSGDTSNVVVTAIAGGLTELLGATLMVVYRKTMAQAPEFTSILERLTTVQSALRVLDSIPEAELKPKNDARARIIELLLLANNRSKGKAKDDEGEKPESKKKNE